MGASYVGSVTIGGAFPMSLQAIGIALVEVNAKLAGFLGVQAALTIQPPTLNAALAASAKVTAELSAAISLGLPGASLQLAAIAGILAEVQASLALLLAMQTTLGESVHMYIYTGTAGAMGQSFSSVLGAGPPGTFPTSQVGAVLVAATIPSARIALGAFCGVHLS